MKSANLKLSVEVMGRGCVTAVNFFIVNNKTQATVGRSSVDTTAGRQTRVAAATLAIADLELWWPRGYADQALYTVEASVGKSAFTTVFRSFGFRKAELIEVRNLRGTSFYFRINNVDIFCGGSCWIPADSFLTRLTREDYRALIKIAADGNQTMLRVWGGGIYEADALYHAADELGVLIWQDFMFYYANYPAYPLYLANVEIEAIQNVRRLRNHPSIVLWAGNTEDYQFIEHLGLSYDPSTQDYNSWLRTNFPARYFYEICLPRIMKAECTNVLYRPSSTFGDGSSSGDIHQWNVWGGNMEPYQRLPDMGGRFVSEFGMQAYPHVSTLKKCITRDEDRYPGKFLRINLTRLLLIY